MPFHTHHSGVKEAVKLQWLSQCRAVAVIKVKKKQKRQIISFLLGKHKKKLYNNKLRPLQTQ